MIKSLTFFILITASTLSFAQQTSLGVTAGVNRSNLGGDSKGASYFTSYHVGLAFRKELGKEVNLTTGIVWSGQGFNATFDTSDKADDINGRYYYFNVPATIDFKIGQSVALKFGPQFGLLANAINKADGKSYNNTVFVRPIDLSLVFGFNIYITPAVQINTNYNWGLTNTLEGADNASYYPNRVLQVGLSYFFTNSKSDANEKK